MGWQIHLIAVHDPELDANGVAAALGYGESVGTASFYDVTTVGFDGAAFAKVGDWIVGSHGMFWADVEDLSGRLKSLGKEAMTFISAGVSSTYGFEHIKGGETRELVLQEGTIVAERGVPSEWEARASGSLEEDGESFVLGLLTDAVASMDTLMQAEFSVYAAQF